MNIHSIICTRNKQINDITKSLLGFYSSNNIKVQLLVGFSSIFEAYAKTLEKIQADDEDIIIFCHDDIEILNKNEEFIKILTEELEENKVCFVGPAGTSYLGPDAIWWNWENHKQGYHRGLVIHIDKEKNLPYPTFYGPSGYVAVLDGLFLAAKVKNLKKINLKKPEIFEGEWDFYDIYYTTQALKAGMVNKAVPISLVHHSRGELVGRDSWHKNREAFIKNNELPIILTEK